MFLSEVKYSWSLFSKKDFDKIKIIAERIKPNVIIFAAYWNLDKQTETKLNKWSSEIDKEFSKYWTKLRYAKIDLDELVYNPY